MKIGCCTNMISNGADGTGIEYIEKLAAIGFDYIELPLAEMNALSNDDFNALVKRVEASKIRCETCNNCFPATMRLTGSEVDPVAITAYVAHAFSRAARLGVEYVVFGSGPAKNIPKGFPMEDGYRQVVKLLQYISAVAAKYGITIVIEPLRVLECNLIHSFQEGCQLAKDVDQANVKVLVDFYHLSQENEPIQHLLDEGQQYLRHVHFARDEGRVFPAKIDEDPNYKLFFDALETIGYDQRISLEAYTSDFENNAPVALQFFRNHT